MTPRVRVLIAMIAAALLFAYGSHKSVNAEIYSVVSVIDGDTIKVQFPGRVEHVRLIGMNTPETHGKGGLKECYGEEATQQTKSLLPSGTKVRLENDVVKRDIYGRMLAYVYRASDNLFIDLELARDGAAETLTIPPNTAHEIELADAVDQAKAEDIGLWKMCGNAHVRIN